MSTFQSYTALLLPAAQALVQGCAQVGSMTASAETLKLAEARLRKPHFRFTRTRYWPISVGLAIFLLIGCSKSNGCPRGTELAGLAPPNGNKQWCQKQDSTGNLIKHGWYREWHPNGQLGALAILDNDYLNEGTVWDEEGRLLTHTFLNMGVLKQTDAFDSEGHKAWSTRVTAEYLAKTKPTRGLTAIRGSAYVGPAFGNASLTVFDSAGDAVTRWDAGSDKIALLSAGDLVASCPAKGFLDDECAPAWPDKNNLAKVKHAVEAFKHMLHVAESRFPGN